MHNPQKPKWRIRNDLIHFSLTEVDGLCGLFSYPHRIQLGGSFSQTYLKGDDYG